MNAFTRADLDRAKFRFEVIVARNEIARRTLSDSRALLDSLLRDLHVFVDPSHAEDFDRLSAAVYQYSLNLVDGL